jgi:hypothetical protein
MEQKLKIYRPFKCFDFDAFDIIYLYEVLREMCHKLSSTPKMGI